ncbi:MAG: hypothetical protein HN465_07180 [Nitrospina sp.]|jgi:hypothetical protein|nr:hypothetical protein [Nitrospina sp.]
MITIKELREAYTRADQKKTDAHNRKIDKAERGSQPKIKSGPVSKAHQAVAKTKAEWDKIRKQTQAGNEKLLMKRMTPAQKKAYIKNKKNKDWEFDYAMAQIGIDTGARIK